MNSGFLSDTDVIAEMTSTFADAEVISRGSSFFIPGPPAMAADGFSRG